MRGEDLWQMKKKLVIFLLSSIGFGLYGQCCVEDLIVNNISFISNGDTLKGTIVSPPGKGSFPAVVHIHGSGPEKRNLGFAKHYAMKGITFLTYDKRGVGESQGEYIGDDEEEDNASPENLILLAQDAYAAFIALKKYEKIDTNKIGLFGGSQIGWIAPITASYDRSIKFMVLFSAPVVTTDQEIYYSNYAEDNPDFFKQYSKSQIDDLMKNAPPTGFDVISYLKKLDIPVLWVYGALDNSVPVSESIKNLKKIEKETHQDYKIKIYKKGDHRLTLPKQKGAPADGVNKYMIDWIKKF